MSLHSLLGTAARVTVAWFTRRALWSATNRRRRSRR